MKKSRHSNKEIAAFCVVVAFSVLEGLLLEIRWDLFRGVGFPAPA